MDDALELYERGMEYFAAHEFAQAVEFLSASFELSPHSKTGQVIGECYLELGKLDQAILYFAAATGLGKRPKASFLLAKALLQGGFLSAATKAARRALDELPHYNEARALLDEINAINETDDCEDSIE